MKNKIYIIGIGGIGISGIARYYLYKGWDVYGSDKVESELIKNLKKEGCNIIIGEERKRINSFFNGPNIKGQHKLVIYTEAIGKNNEELKEAKNLKLQILTYPEALAQIVNNKKLITVAGTHGKSTTTSLISLILKNSNAGVNAIIGTILKEFGNKNTYFSNSQYFVIEACEYKRSFLKYKPSVAIIINIDLDHLDYYKDLDDYISAFKEYIDNIVPGGFLIINAEDKNCQKLIGLREDINYIKVYDNCFVYNNKSFNFPEIQLNIPGRHILFDAKIAYIVGHMIGINDDSIKKSLSVYNGVWRRMETIGNTVNNNILISDYGHHPNEITPTIKAIKDKYVDKKIFVIFQPHQYNRTIELLEGFKDCFIDVDKLIIPNIYESRDSKVDKEKINSEKLIKLINHKNKIDGKGLENTLKLINKYDKENPNSSIILLLGAGDIDNLRYKIKIKKSIIEVNP